jgi:ABC-type transport system substrate-binding protein
MKLKSVNLALFLAILITLITLLSACKSSPSSTSKAASTTTSTTYPAPPTTYSLSGKITTLAPTGAYVTAKRMNIDQQQTGYRYKLDVQILTITEIYGLTDPVKAAQGKVVTVYSNESLWAFKANDSITCKVRNVYSLPNKGVVVQFVENVVKK